ncbi:tetratricopeptide repeat protein [Leptolyngbya sp. NIES-2104]|uniref:tetratricopeptide repeat protein n=1 Tax=Leptolyngbya sp. NIES-2104 TaxID=1552121 RepID=UPI0006EC69FB|nr:tetratricopeptide repeat protein [Leptolyngbya sp. NIES-2104]GAP97383.1 high-affnity carbon uptake protein Hat/HatR [Leptolyngbya sp. NIES-2104]
MGQPLKAFTLKNEETYERLISLIENSQDRLALIVVACDDLRLRQQVIDRYESEAKQAKIRPFRIVLETEPSLRSGLASLELGEGYPAVVTVTGTEWLLRVTMREAEEQSDLDKFFGYLQWTREGLREFCYPIVLWVTHRILREMSKRAPDFWSWRKAVLRFASEEEEPTIALWQGEPRSPSIQERSDDKFLPPLEELLSEIQQLEAVSAESANLAMLYDQLGQVYAARIANGAARDLAQERQQAIAAFQSSVNQHQKLNNQVDLIGVLLRLGNFLSGQSQYEAAISAYQQSLEIAREIGDRGGEAASLGNLGVAYQSLGQYQRAIDFHQQSLEIKREIGDRGGEAASLGNLGIAYDSLGQHQRAVEFHQQHYEIAREIGDRGGEAASLGNLGIAYDSLGQHQRAVEFHQQHYEIAREIGDRGGEAASLGGLGNGYDSLGQHQRAVDFYQQSLEIAHEIGDRRGEANSRFNLGLTLAKLKRKKKSIEALQSARGLYQEMGLDHMVERCDSELRPTSPQN